MPAPSFLRTLGLAGWDGFDPVVLAAVAAEAPLLLVGPHGSAKTMVLNRLAEALGLEHRHYNASLLSFDDLVGFPVPEGGRVVYLKTPATVWEAESVLVDEVSRCRPEVQNKPFPLVHERVLEGMPLPKLRHRWGAEGARGEAARLVAAARGALEEPAPGEEAVATEYGMLLAAHRSSWAATGMADGSARASSTRSTSCGWRSWRRRSRSWGFPTRRASSPPRRPT